MKLEHTAMGALVLYSVCVAASTIPIGGEGLAEWQSLLMLGSSVALFAVCAWLLWKDATAEVPLPQSPRKPIDARAPSKPVRVAAFFVVMLSATTVVVSLLSRL